MELVLKGAIKGKKLLCVMKCSAINDGDDDMDAWSMHAMLKPVGVVNLSLLNRNVVIWSTACDVQNCLVHLLCCAPPVGVQEELE